MAAIDMTRPRAGKSGLSIASLLGALAAWNDARMTRNALSRLSNRELDDIGLLRSDIETVVNGDIIR